MDHEHDDECRTVETVEVDTMRNGEHDTYERRIYVCSVTDEELDGDPDVDAAEARADYEADNWDPDR